MGCSFHYIRPNPYQDFGPGCQFVDEEKFYECDGKEWCIYHLSMKDANNQKTEKGRWDDTCIEPFNEKAFALILELKKRRESIDFTGVIFPGVIFFNDIFDKKKGSFPRTSFAKAQFLRQTSFKGIQFGENALFKDSIFMGRAEFEDVVFEGHISFGDSEFYSSAIFEGAHFKDFVFFNRAKFHWIANFSRVTFGKWVYFNDADFGISASYETEEERKNNLKNKLDPYKANFNKTIFKKKSEFKRTKFYGNVDFKGDLGQRDPKADIFQEIDFSMAIFERDAEFSNRKFLEKADFSNAVFKFAPEFHECELHQDTDFGNPNFHDFESVNAARAYRTLKLAMENHRAWDEAAMFYAFEQRSLRHQPLTPFGIKLFSFLYDMVSDYGRSFVRPIFWLGVIAGLSFLTYAIWVNAVGNASPGDAFIFTMQQIVRPFFVWTGSYMPLDGINPHYPSELNISCGDDMILL